MSSSGSKWLTGCGIGCAAALLLVVALGTGGYLFFKSKMQGFADAEAAGAELTQKYGKIADFCPDPSGRIAPERIQVFLEVRDRCAPARRGLETAFGVLSEGIHQAKEGRDSIPEILDIIRKGFGVVPQLGEFQGARTRALLEAGMGPGEYVYIYVLAYYSWLGKSPGDGPEFRIQDQQGIVAEDSGRGGDVRELRREELTRRIQRPFLAMLRSQRAKLDEGQAEVRRDAWHKALDAEISALESTDPRLPWAKGLPKVIEDSLTPFRERLMESYSPMVNPLEPVFWTEGSSRGRWR